MAPDWNCYLGLTFPGGFLFLDVLLLGKAALILMPAYIGTTLNIFDFGKEALLGFLC